MQIHQWIDGGVFAVSMWLAHWMRMQFAAETNFLGMTIQWNAIQPFSPNYFTLFWFVIPIAPLVLEGQGWYKRSIFSSRHIVILQLFKSCAITTIGLILTLYILRYETARGVLVLFGFVSFFLMLVKDELVRWSYINRNVLDRKRIVLLGTPEDTKRLHPQMAASREDTELAGEFDLTTTTITELVEFLHKHSINGVILCAKHTYFGQIEKAIQACEVEGIETWLAADFFRTRIAKVDMDDFYGIPVLVFQSGPAVTWSLLCKQVIDFFGALFLLILTSPILLGVALMIKITSPGPIFFRQQRAGLNGRPFTMYKFRSMVTDAEQLKQELANLNEMSGPVFKITEDPRVTRVGRFLRKFSLDEFPQLFNVLRGDMSLVGPRPLPVDEVARFDDVAHRRRLSVKPGLTCLWQISGRNNISDFDEWVRLDLEYIDNWSLALDVQILWLTVPVVLLGKGAK